MGLGFCLFLGCFNPAANSKTLPTFWCGNRARCKRSSGARALRASEFFNGGETGLTKTQRVKWCVAKTATNKDDDEGELQKEKAGGARAKAGPAEQRMQMSSRLG